jgi:hypothetical protein
VGGVYLNYLLYLQVLTCRAPGSEIDPVSRGGGRFSTHSSRAKLNTITNTLPSSLSLPKFGEANSYLYPVHKSEPHPPCSKTLG